ncbi:MAG TPA: glycosyltransferase family 2 protein [Blastocatellia bacterium]|nr:glycosyltransferase family 2 protein [Blastocatellia bacterium]
MKRKRLNRNVQIVVEPTASARLRVTPGCPVRASVIIVSYNAKEKLLRCLASLLRSLPDSCEVVVVDNASCEDNADAIEAGFPQATLIRSNTNLGFSGGCNLGARHAQGQYLVFLNPDTLVENGWIEALVAALEADARAGLATAKILLLDQPDRLNTCGCNIHLTGLTLCRGMGRSRELYGKPDYVTAISGAAFAIRRELFEKLEGFDEHMFLYMEDTDLSLRARLAGWRTLYTPDSVVLHDYRLRIFPLKVFYQERNRYLMLLKNLRWPTLFVLLPVFLLAEVITWSFVLLSDRANIGNKVQAYRWVLNNWAVVRQKRRQAQALRAVSDRQLLKETGFELDFGQAAGEGVATLARFVFTPIFFVLRKITLALVWW